jgi:putative photosynthetic complex assembly protein
VTGTHRDNGSTVSSRHSDEIVLPRGLLIGSGIMVAIALATAYIARTTDYGATRLQPDTVVKSRDLTFLTAPDGTLNIRDVTLGQTLQTLTAKSDGFIKVVLRDLTQQRAMVGADASAPYKLSQHSDGQLTLEDYATKRIITLTAFGKVNTQVFGNLLKSGSSAP